MKSHVNKSITKEKIFSPLKTGHFIMKALDYLDFLLNKKPVFIPFTIFVYSILFINFSFSKLIL